MNNETKKSASQEESSNQPKKAVAAAANKRKQQFTKNPFLCGKGFSLSVYRSEKPTRPIIGNLTAGG